MQNRLEVIKFIYTKSKSNKLFKKNICDKGRFISEISCDCFSIAYYRICC